MAQTFVQKILAKYSGKKEVKINEIVTIKPDHILTHDNTAAIIGTFNKIGVSKVFNPNQPVIVLDHCIPAATEKYAQNHKEIREFVKEQGLPNFYDINKGVCHQVVPEEGFVRPGGLVVGSDSHTTTYGAFGAFSCSIVRSEAAYIWATGEIWLKVPESFKIIVTGKFSKGVSAKDLILYIINDLRADGATYKSVEFYGETISEMSISERMVLSNMTAEMGGKNGICFADAKTEEWLKGRVKLPYEPVLADEDAKYERILKYNVDELEPQIAYPHTVDNVKPISESLGIKIEQALIGTCTNGRLEDLEKAARILKGKTVAIRTLVFPASWMVYKDALNKGVISDLIDSGCVIMNPGCGPCLGAHEGTLAPKEVCISTANRNFKGRMGCKEAFVYLGSPETVAASALKGEIADPREVI